jgi:hypothetical protein
MMIVVDDGVLLAFCRNCIAVMIALHAEIRRRRLEWVGGESACCSSLFPSECVKFGFPQPRGILR